MAGSTTKRLVKMLNRCIPEIYGQKVTWDETHIYPCRGFWRIRRVQMDVMSWEASARNETGRIVWNGGCWETMTECLKAGQIHIHFMTGWGRGRSDSWLTPDPPKEEP